MPQSCTSLFHHIIFSTKNRLPQISDDLATQLYPYVGGIIRDCDSSLIAIGGMPDHLHLLVNISKEKSVAEILRIVKANSSRWIHQTFPEQSTFAWQSGYGAFTVSPLNVTSIKRYILTQREHHRTMMFQEEFQQFLEHYRIPYNGRYLWE
ncbi:MAG TPA: IS200/IS605 family transposase [Candidatus Kapabacteria bacterium]|nr:IS200/IS605 family transposase [Candidatus Kapabacteria bacterium]